VPKDSAVKADALLPLSFKPPSELPLHGVVAHVL
jgi:hypothetical protein